MSPSGNYPIVPLKEIAVNVPTVKINIISWLSKNSTAEYDKAVTLAKRQWLSKHLKSVSFDNIDIVPYGTPKQTISSGILFDDEKPNRDNWIGQAFDVDSILDILKGLA